jgi:glycosyltransferase involved in cell wall biosynthesis
LKIAIYYTRPFETGGVEKTMCQRGKELNEKGYDITFIYASNDSPLDMLEKWSEYGDVKHLSICENEKFDYCIYDAVYNLKKVNAKRYIQVINGCLIDSNENYEELIPFNEYVAVSEEASKQFKDRKGKECKIIPNLINQKEILKLSKEECDVPKAKYLFLTVSRLDPQKGFERIEKILQELEAKEIDYHWLFIGSNYLYPGYGEQIKQRFSKYKTTFLGKQDNPYKYMSKVNYLVQLSDYESQCMVMYESLICGTPVIATDFPNAVKELQEKGNGIVLKKDMSNLDVELIINSKFNIKYNYPNYIDKWVEILKPIEKKNYKFSVIIPNYNNAKWLDKCLNSVLNQTYKNYEIIFIDDMSTDNSLEIANNLLKEHKVIELKQKRLNGGSRNVGIIEATGDYIICIDSDDWLKSNDVLEEINDNLDEQDVMFLGFELGKDGKEELYPFRPNYTTLEQAFVNDVCAIWTKVVKTEILKDTLFPEGTLAEDRVHHYRVIDKCKSFTCLNKSTHIWNRSNTTSVTTDRGILWEASIYKHLGEMYMFIATTKNETYKKYVKDKFKRQLQEISNNKYQQL